MAALHDLPGLAASISTALAKEGIRHAVSGALAMAVHGVVRATKDLDLLVVAPQLRIPKVFAIVRAHGFEGDDPALIEALRENGYAQLVSGPVSVEILAPVLPYHHTLPDRAAIFEVSGASVPFVSIEDLVVLKMLWRRPKDVPDVHNLIAAGGNAFDADYARSTLAGILPDDDPRHAELADWIRRFGGAGGGATPSPAGG